jgi:ornithine cyclodeaminase
MELAEECFHSKAAGAAVCGREVSIKPYGPDGGVFYSLPAYHKGLGMACVKWTSHVRNPASPMYTKPLILLNDLNSGTPLALVDGHEISAARTGGVTGVAMKRLAHPRSEHLLCCGAGHQAKTQIRAAIAAMPNLRHISVWNRSVYRASELCLSIKAEYESSLTFEPIADFDKAAHRADIIIGATSAPSPYLHEKHFSDGQLYIHIGMNDIAPEAIHSFDSIVCDDFEAGLEGSSQSLFRLSRNEPDIYRRVILMENFLRYDISVSSSLGKRIMFNSFGLPIFDLVLAAAAYRYAAENGLGEEVKINDCYETGVR